MKKLLCLMLALVTVLSLAACQEPISTQTATSEQATEDGYYGTPVTGNTPSKELATVPTPMTWKTLNDFPLANNNMSLEQRRQLCADFFKLAQTFQWTPNEDINFVVSATNKHLSFPVGQVYAGVPYITEAKAGSVYIAMQFYDEQTGVMDVKSVGGKNFAFLIGNHCSSGAFWGWGRVVNSTSCRTTPTMVPKNGCIPVGDYEFNRDVEQWNSAYTTFDVTKANGEQKMFEAYAKLQTADGIVRVNDKGSGHVCMISAKAVVVRDGSGKIDGKNSYVLLHEQTSTPKPVTLQDGAHVVIEGRIDEKDSFESMFKAGYLPFTFAELIGTDPVEAASASVNLGGSTVTPDALSDSVVTSNYAIAYVKLIVTDKDGKELYTKYGNNSKYNKMDLEMNLVALPATLKRYATGENKVKLECFVSTGQNFTVYEGTLVSQ